MNKTIENRRGFLTRILAGTAAAAALTQIPAAQGSTVRASPADKISQIRAYCNEAKELYDAGTEEQKQTMIERLYDDYRRADCDAVRKFILNLGAFLINE